MEGGGVVGRQMAPWNFVVLEECSRGVEAEEEGVPERTPREGHLIRRHAARHNRAAHVSGTLPDGTRSL
jgi:hypothetical protein